MQKKREEVLSTEVARLNDFADDFDKVLKQNIFTVFGNENQIRKNEDLFKSLVKVFS
jgi:Zn-dependent M16 (insulinase) family peptidase